MENGNITSSNLPSQSVPPVSPEEIRRQRRIIIGLSLGLFIFIVLLVGSFILLLNAPPQNVELLRDILIIYMALQSMLVGFVLIILIIQLARLTNLLQNEIKPILTSLDVTTSTLRGTTTFLSDSLTEPVIKMNEYMAGISKLLVLLGIIRKVE